MNPQIIRDAKGRIIKGVAQDTNKNGTGHAPCKCCQNKEEILKKTQEFIDQCKADKTKVPFIEELAMNLGVDDETILNWYKNKEDHPEFYALMRIIQTFQKLKLQYRVLGRYNPTGAMFLLRVHHNMVEVSKQIRVGDDGGPMKYEIEIIEDKSAGTEDKND